MAKSIITLIILLIIFLCPSFAGEGKVFTDDDLNKYHGGEPQIVNESPKIIPPDDLGKAYKSQLDEYNREIKLSNSMFNIHMKESKEMIDKKYPKLATEQLRQAEKYLDKVKAAQGKRAELKIKVLEHDNQIPSWWHEE
jgi:hypothetical protein